MRPPKFFDRGYEPDFCCSDPLAELVAALLKGDLNGYLNGNLLSEAQRTQLFAEGIWTQKDLGFIPREVRTVWRQQIVDAKATQATAHAEARATNALAGFLRGTPDATRDEAKAWLRQHDHPFTKKGFQYRVWPGARKLADLGDAMPGRPRKNRYPKSLP